MSDTVRADRRLRGVTVAAVVVLIVAGIVLLKILLPQYLDYLRTLAQTDPDRLHAEYERAFFWMFGLMGVLGGLIGLHTLRLGLRTRRAGAFPPPGVKVIVDTRMLHGRRAHQLALALIVGGALFALAAVGLAVGLHAATRDMLGPALPAPMPAPSGDRG